MMYILDLMSETKQVYRVVRELGGLCYLCRAVGKDGSTLGFAEYLMVLTVEYDENGFTQGACMFENLNSMLEYFVNRPNMLK